MATISQSVGRGGRNGSADTKTIQSLLNANIAAIRPTAPLVEDGKNGPKTINAITAFQRSVVKLNRPDGRVDPGGKTFAALQANGASALPVGRPGAPPPISGALDGSPAYVDQQLAAADEAAETALAALRVGAASSKSVTYHSGVKSDRRLVSSYAFRVLERALANAGMSGVVITSTMRIPSEQAAIMHKNAKKNLSGQYKLYGGTGDKVLDVYRDNKDSKTEAEVIALMEAKIESLTTAGMIVSRHCSTEAAYRNRNIIDMGVNSTKALGDSGFSISGFTKALQQLQNDGFIAKFIDETAKSNTCWHVEIIPDVKPIPSKW